MFCLFEVIIEYMYVLFCRYAQINYLQSFAILGQLLTLTVSCCSVHSVQKSCSTWYWQPQLQESFILHKGSNNICLVRIFIKPIKLLDIGLEKDIILTFLTCFTKVQLIYIVFILLHWSLFLLYIFVDIEKWGCWT